MRLTNILASQRILITGGAGFVGANLVRRLLRDFPETKLYLIVRDSSSLWRLDGILDKVTLVDVDLSDRPALKKAVTTIQPEVIFHLAAYGAYARDNTLSKAVLTNITGLENLLEALESVDYKLFVNTGSSSEYGYKTQPMSEKDVLEPNSHYSATKGAATMLASSYGQIHQKPIVTLRLFSIYGPYEEPGRLIPTVAFKALHAQQIDMVGGQIVRDFVYVEDAIDAYLACLKLKNFDQRVFNVCSGIQTPILKVAKKLKKLANSDSKIVVGSFQPRPWDTASWVGNPKLARTVLGWTPQHSLEEGLKKSLQWFSENENLYTGTPKYSPETLTEIARQIRRTILKISHNAHIGHIGSSFSIVDILITLYFSVLNVHPSDPQWENRDRFILSKGHAAAALYSILHKRGFFDRQTLETFCQDGSRLLVHPEYNQLPGIDAGTGSLGHGLSLGVGMAVAAKKLSKGYRTFVLISDGESEEGSVWEAAIFAGHHKLNNLTVIVDCNGTQGLGQTKDILNLEPLDQKWSSFGWEVTAVDGHNISQLLKAFSKKSDKPHVILAGTIMGRGVSFMEGNFQWHYYDMNPQQLQAALEELQ